MTETERGRKTTSYRMDAEVKQMLREMSKDDLRTLSAELEYLVREEYERRKNPHTLIDTPAPCRAEVEG